MPSPAARQGDPVVAPDMHPIRPPGPAAPVPVPLPRAGDAASGCDCLGMRNARVAAVGMVGSGG